MHATPFLRLLLPFVFGLSLGNVFDLPVPGLGFGLVLGAALLAVLAKHRFPYARRWVFGAYSAVYFLVAGYWHIVSYNELRRNDHFSNLNLPVQCVVGTVCEAPTYGSRVRVPLRVEAAGDSARGLVPCSGRLMLFLKADTLANGIRYGDGLKVWARIGPTEGPKNPHAFDYRRYLHFQNIHFQAFPKSDSVQLLGRDRGHWIWRVAYAQRDRLLALLRRHFPDPDEHAVAAALLVGYKDDLSEGLRKAYMDTGSMHALAVSGSHVAMLHLFLWWLLGRVPVATRAGRMARAGLALSVIWAFTFLTGATASVLRAAVMFTIFLLGQASWRESNVWNTLAASAWLLLAYNPYFLFDAGFQLSYAAVAGMVFFYPRLYRLAPVWPKMIDEPFKALLVGCAAQLGTLPLGLYYFHQFPIYFWLAGWVVLAFGALFMGGGALLVALDWLWPNGAEGLAWVLQYLLRGLNWLIVAIQQLPGSTLDGIWITPWAAVVLYGAIALAGAALALRKYWPGHLALGLLLLLGIAKLYAYEAQAQQRSVVFYHVRKHTFIDFFDGTRLHTLSDSIPEKQIASVAQTNRWAMGADPWQQDLFWLDTFQTVAHAKSGAWELMPPFVQFHGKIMAVVTPEVLARPQAWASLRADVLLLSGNPRTTVEACRQRFPCDWVVFDASNSPRNVARWESECAAHGWPYRNIAAEGAWIWEIGDK